MNTDTLSTILLVGFQEETHQLILDALRRSLRDTKFESIASVSEALKRIFSANPPDLIISALSITPEGGFSLLRKLRNDHGLKIPVIILDRHIANWLKDDIKEIGGLSAELPLVDDVFLQWVRQIIATHSTENKFVTTFVP